MNRRHFPPEKRLALQFRDHPLHVWEEMAGLITRLASYSTFSLGESRHQVWMHESKNGLSLSFEISKSPEFKITNIVISDQWSNALNDDAEFSDFDHFEKTFNVLLKLKRAS